MVSLTPQQRDTVIRTIAGEAANEGIPGWAGVGAVIMNRTQDGRFPTDPAAVALQKSGQTYQFTTWSPKYGNNMPHSISPNSLMYQDIGNVVDGLWSGQIPDPTGGAVNYYNPRIAHPPWASKLAKQNDVTIGNHRFVGKMLGVLAGGDIPRGPPGSEKDGLGITRTLRPGSGSRSQVRALQTALNAAGIPVKVDGSYGPQTKAAVQAFQAANGLTADGIVGPQTRAVLTPHGPDLAGMQQPAGGTLTPNFPADPFAPQPPSPNYIFPGSPAPPPSPMPGRPDVPQPPPAMGAPTGPVQSAALPPLLSGGEGGNLGRPGAASETLPGPIPSPRSDPRNGVTSAFPGRPDAPTGGFPAAPTTSAFPGRPDAPVGAFPAAPKADFATMMKELGSGPGFVPPDGNAISAEVQRKLAEGRSSMKSGAAASDARWTARGVSMPGTGPKAITGSGALSPKMISSADMTMRPDSQEAWTPPPDLPEDLQVKTDALARRTGIGMNIDAATAPPTDAMLAGKTPYHPFAGSPEMYGGTQPKADVPVASGMPSMKDRLDQANSWLSQINPLAPSPAEAAPASPMPSWMSGPNPSHFQSTVGPGSQPPPLPSSMFGPLPPAGPGPQIQPGPMGSVNIPPSGIQLAYNGPGVPPGMYNPQSMASQHEGLVGGSPTPATTLAPPSPSAARLSAPIGAPSPNEFGTYLAGLSPPPPAAAPQAPQPPQGPPAIAALPSAVPSNQFPGAVTPPALPGPPAADQPMDIRPQVAGGPVAQAAPPPSANLAPPPSPQMQRSIQARVQQSPMVQRMFGPGSIFAPGSPTMASIMGGTSLGNALSSGMIQSGGYTSPITQGYVPPGYHAPTFNPLTGAGGPSGGASSAYSYNPANGTGTYITPSGQVFSYNTNGPGGMH